MNEDRSISPETAARLLQAHVDLASDCRGRSRRTSRGAVPVMVLVIVGLLVAVASLDRPRHSGVDRTSVALELESRR